MKFLVVLSCLLINHYWRKERAIPRGGWFDSYQSWVQETVRRLPPAVRQLEIVSPLILLLLPILGLVVLLWLLNGVLFGFINLGLHILILVLALDRVNMVQLTARYLKLWREGDFEGAWELLQAEVPERMDGSFADYAALHQKYCDLLLSSYFERVFVVVFWYLLLGPAGVVLCLVTRLYCAKNYPAGVVQWPNEDGASTLIQRLAFILEWLPARVLALTFSLAGDFVSSFSRLKEHSATAGSGLQLLRFCAVAALGSVSTRIHSELAESGAYTAADEAADETFPDWAARQLEELLSLLQRSQVIWLALLALLTLYGIGQMT